MQCPNCVQEKLQPIITKKGVEIDFCSNCSGIWLDNGEILLLTSQPELIQKKIDMIYVLDIYKINSEIKCAINQCINKGN